MNWINLTPRNIVLQAHYAEEESQMFKIFEASAEETIDGDDEEEEEDEPEG